MTEKNNTSETKRESDHLPPGSSDDSVAPRPRNLILFSDGTGNQGGVTPDTNVRRLYHAIDRHDHKKDPTRPEQIAFYDDGVGTEALKWPRRFAGAFGWGLSRNIRELYTFLVKNYRPGDRIFLFGFSRGAFTVRSLAGMIARCGIIKIPSEMAGQDDLAECVMHAYYAYKYAHFRCRDNPTGEELEKCGIHYRSDWRVITHCGESGQYQPEGRHVPIHFIGVWDTVDAVGLPVDELRDGLAGSIRLAGTCSSWALRKLPVLKFSGHTLQPQVRNAFHALAIDDERQTFHPLLWTEPEPNASGNQRVKQVWFCGMHSNVGGGYPKDQLAHVPLDWMLARAKVCGLRVHPSHQEEFDHQKNTHGQMHDSRSGLAVYYRYHPRDIAKLWEEAGNDRKNHPILVHESVLDRIERATQDYAPVALPAEFQVVTDDGARTPFWNWATLPPAPEQKPKSEWVKDRGKALQEAWKAICGGRLLYFIFLAVNLLFVLVVFHRLDSGGSGISGNNSACIDLLNVKLQWFAPQIVAEPVDALFRHPLWLGFFVGALTVILRLRGWFRWRKRFHAQRAWCEVRPVHVGVPRPRWFSGPDWAVIIATGSLLWCYGPSSQTWWTVGALILIYGLIGRFHKWIHGRIRQAWNWLRPVGRMGNRSTGGNAGDRHD